MIKPNIFADFESRRAAYLEKIDFNEATLLRDFEIIEERESHRIVNFEKRTCAEITNNDLLGGIKWRQSSQSADTIDPLHEIRQIRDVFASRFNNDFDALLKELQQRKKLISHNSFKAKVAEEVRTYSPKKKDK